MSITPDQARELLDGATPGPWSSHHDEWEDENGIDCEDFYVIGGTDGILSTENFDPDNHDPVANTALAAAAPDLAQTIAGMTEEWGVDANGDALFPVREEGHPMGSYFTEDRAEAEGVRDRMAKLNPHINYLLVRRLVSAPEVVEGE